MIADRPNPSGAPEATSMHLLHLMADETARRQAITANTRMVLELCNGVNELSSYSHKRQNEMICR